MEVYQSVPLLPITDVALSDDPQVNEDLAVVARSATEEFSTLFSLSPPARIRPVSILYATDGHPRTVSTPEITKYKVYLFVTNRDYSRLVYQLGHELCHIFVDPRRSNWFVESCCAMASTVLLCRMSKLWLNNPLRADWRSYAHHFQQYAEDVIRRARQADQPDARQGQVFNAEILRPLFDESLQNWNALCFLGQASTCPPADLADYNARQVGFSFDRWLQAVPPYLRGIVRRIYEIPAERWDHRL
jgi:hypothetical protein